MIEKRVREITLGKRASKKEMHNLARNSCHLLKIINWPAKIFKKLLKKTFVKSKKLRVLSENSTLFAL